MDNEELLERFKIEIRLAISEGMAAHIAVAHDNLWREIAKLQARVNFWRGAIAIIGVGFTVLVAFLETFRK